MRIKNLIEGLNAQQRSVPQLPAMAKAKHISVLGAKKDPKHPFSGYMVGADESISEEFDPDNNPWRVTDVDPMSETDFEVALQGPGGQQLNFVIRPVDFMETQLERYQIDSMDVRDLQTGKTMHWGSMNNLGRWLPIFDAIDDYFWNSPPLQAQLAKIVDYHMDAGEQGKNPDLMPGLDKREPHGVAVSADDFIASHDKTQAAMAKMKKGVEETTGDPKFDKMLKGITGKREVAKQQKTDTKQQARDAFGGMFGGGNPADKLSIRKKGVPEGRAGVDDTDTVGFSVNTEAAYMAVMKRFGHVIDHDETSGIMYAPARVWPQIEMTAFDADPDEGAVRVEDDMMEAERNEMDTPAVQAALAKMAERHKGEKWSKEQLAALGKRIAARGKKTVKEDVTKEDIISKLKARLGDYLSDIGQEIRKDPDLVDKLAARAPGDQMGPPVKTVTTDDGHQISIHGNEDDGFRISIKNKPSASKFANLDEAVMACEMYCARRRSQTLNADYVEEA